MSLKALHPHAHTHTHTQRVVAGKEGDLTDGDMLYPEERVTVQQLWDEM